MAKRSIIMELCRIAQRDYEHNRNAASHKIEEAEAKLRRIAASHVPAVEEAIVSGNLHQTTNGALYIQLQPRQRRARTASAQPAA